MYRDASNPEPDSDLVRPTDRQAIPHRSGLSWRRLRRLLRRAAPLLPIIICAYLMLALYLNSVPGLRNQMHQDHPIAESTVLDVAVPDVIRNMLDILSLPRYLLEQWIAQFQQPDPIGVVETALATAGPGVATAAAQPAPADTPTPVDTASQPAPAAPPAPTSTAQTPSAEPTATTGALASATPTPTIGAATPITSATASATPTTTESPTSTPTPTETGTTGPTETATPIASITVKPPRTDTPTPAETTTATASATAIPPPPPPASSTPTPIATATASSTATATGTATGTATASSTATPTPTPTTSSTPTGTPTPTATATSTPSRTPTPTLTPTPSRTPTPTLTPAPIRIEPDYIPCEAGSDQVLQVNGTVRRDWEPQRQFEYTFQAPAQSVIEVLGYAKEGHPERGCPGGSNCGDVQLHEEFTVSVNAEPIGAYRDRGDIHEWVNFGVWKSSPVPQGQQTLVVRHLGEGTGAQSVDFKLTICMRPSGAVQVPTSTSTMTPTTTATP